MVLDARTQQKILGWLRCGYRIWYPTGSLMAWVCLPEPKKIRVKTLHEMAKLDLIEFESQGNDSFPDWIAKEKKHVNEGH
jgi:hypothetical protein